uniref:Uncharacterized protein n=1 Tax=Strongyloides stercoralis TaxID=6248 RepID=A0A0K0EDS1_STRER
MIDNFLDISTLGPPWKILLTKCMPFDAVVSARFLTI